MRIVEVRPVISSPPKGELSSFVMEVHRLLHRLQREDFRSFVSIVEDFRSDGLIWLTRYPDEQPIRGRKFGGCQLISQNPGREICCAGGVKMTSSPSLLIGRFRAGDVRSSRIEIWKILFLSTRWPIDSECEVYIARHDGDQI